MGYAEIIGSGTIPETSDTQRLLLSKLVKVAVAGSVSYGQGAPVGNPTGTQVFYLDELNGQIYINQGGVWTLYTAPPASGITGVYAWNGVGPMPTAQGAAILLGAVGSSAEGLMWKKTSAGTNNTDWVAI